MGHLEGTPKHRGSPQTPSHPTIEHLLQDEGSLWNASLSPTYRNIRFEDDHFHHNKKSVLARVREKAKKWRQSLLKKKHNSHNNVTPAWGVTLDDEDDHDDNKLHEQHAEHLRAPMYESELVAGGYKEEATNPHRPVTSVPPVPGTDGSESGPRTQEKRDWTISETVTEKLAPAYAAVAEATHAITSKIQQLTIGSQNPAENDNSSSRSPTMGGQMWDKGVSVKEYLMQKLEPGDDERALSEIITDAISPKKASEDMGMAEKVKEAVTSLLHAENDAVASVSASNCSSHIPLSTNIHQDVQQPNGERMLQAN